MLQFVALKPVLRESLGFVGRRFFFFPNQQIYQVNFIHFNLVINLVKSLNLQLYVVWQNSLYYYAALNLPKFLLQPIRKQNTVKRA